MKNHPTRDTSQLNPAATARRRLLKTLGMGAAAGMVSLDWTRPIVRLGALPAHAQASPNFCEITMQRAIEMAEGSVSLYLTLDLSGTLQATSSTTGSPSASLELVHLPTQSGTYSATFQWAMENSTSEIIYSYSQADLCCDESRGNSAQQTIASSSNGLLNVGISLDIFDDGTCSTFIPD